MNSLNAGEGLRAEIESAAAEYREMLKAAFSEHEKPPAERFERKGRESRRHPRLRAGYERGHAVEPPERDACYFSGGCWY